MDPGRAPSGPGVYLTRLRGLRGGSRPALQALSARMGDRIEIREVDVLAAREVARAFGIFSVPTTVVVDGRGEVVAFNIGVTSTEQLLAQLPGPRG